RGAPGLATWVRGAAPAVPLRSARASATYWANVHGASRRPWRMYASASLPSSMPARLLPSAALAAAASPAAAAASKWPRPIVRRTLQPLLESSLATARRSAALSDPDAHAGGGLAGAVHATRVSADTPPKRSTPGPSERSRRTRLPLPPYCAIWRRLETSKERPRNRRGTR